LASLALSRDFDISRPALFDALTRAEVLPRWFWPERFQTKVTSDPRPGGGYSIKSEVVGIGVSGTYTEVAPDHLTLTWAWDGDPAETVVTMDLEEAAPGRSRVRLRHEGFATEKERDDHVVGWNDCFDRLAAYRPGEHRAR
jgi:uncharacterized protein YndB with AHSA1/START domain